MYFYIHKHILLLVHFVVEPHAVFVTSLLSVCMCVCFNASSFFTSTQSIHYILPIYVCQVCISLGGYESVFCQLLAHWVA
jgi:hypothetical protein